MTTIWEFVVNPKTLVRSWWNLNQVRWSWETSQSICESNWKSRSFVQTCLLTLTKNQTRNHSWIQRIVNWSSWSCKLNYQLLTWHCFKRLTFHFHLWIFLRSLMNFEAQSRNQRWKCNYICFRIDWITRIFKSWCERKRCSIITQACQM